MKKLYLFLAIIGFLLPYYFLVSFLLENGPDLALLINQLFVNPITTFFAVDLIITGIVLLVFIYQEAHKLGMGNWWAYGLPHYWSGHHLPCHYFCIIASQNLNNPGYRAVIDPSDSHIK